MELLTLPTAKVVNVALEACPSDPSLLSHRLSAVVQWAAQLVRTGVPEKVDPQKYRTPVRWLSRLGHQTIGGPVAP